MTGGINNGGGYGRRVDVRTGNPAVVSGGFGAAIGNSRSASSASQAMNTENSIQAAVKGDKVIVSTLVFGHASAWVEFDAKQMDDLIEALKAARAQI